MSRPPPSPPPTASSAPPWTPSAPAATTAPRSTTWPASWGSASRRSSTGTRPRRRCSRRWSTGAPTRSTPRLVRGLERAGRRLRARRGDGAGDVPPGRAAPVDARLPPRGHAARAARVEPAARPPVAAHRPGLGVPRGGDGRRPHAPPRSAPPAPAPPTRWSPAWRRRSRCCAPSARSRRSPRWCTAATSSCRSSAALSSRDGTTVQRCSRTGSHRGSKRPPSPMARAIAGRIAEATATAVGAPRRTGPQLSRSRASGGDARQPCSMHG